MLYVSARDLAGTRSKHINAFACIARNVPPDTIKNKAVHWTRNDSCWYLSWSQLGSGFGASLLDCLVL